MQFQPSDLAALKDALLSGAKSVSVQGRTVVFQDPIEIKKLIREIEEAIAAEAAPTEVPVSPRSIQGRFTRK